jgi:hypothetical protein
MMITAGVRHVMLAAREAGNTVIAGSRRAFPILAPRS